MNLVFRILVAVYSAISAAVCGLIMISPFAEKGLMRRALEYMNVTFYWSNRYDVVIFLFGLVFMLLNLTILFSGLRVRSTNKYFCVKNETGIVRVSANAIENIALAIAKQNGSVRDARARAHFRRSRVEILVKLAVYPDTHVPNLSAMLQNYIKETVENMTEMSVGMVDISVEGVHARAKTEEG